VLFSLSHKLIQAKPRQKELCVQQDVFFSLLSYAFQALFMDSSSLALFPDRGALLKGYEGEHFEKRAKGNVLGSVYPEDSLNNI
jgi:hypothetical protein